MIDYIIIYFMTISTYDNVYKMQVKLHCAYFFYFDIDFDILGLSLLKLSKIWPTYSKNISTYISPIDPMNIYFIIIINLSFEIENISTFFIEVFKIEIVWLLQEEGVLLYNNVNACLS